jgi:hypothetical protein
MGRPRKRMREDAPEIATETVAETPSTDYTGHDISLNGSSTLSNYTNFGLNSSPGLEDLSSGGNNYEILPHDFAYTETHGGTIPVSNAE